MKRKSTEVNSLFLNERGVAMTEAVIVLPFFILIWMGLVMLHGLFEGNLEAQVAAKNEALGKAMVSCCKENERASDPEEESSKIDDQTLDWLDKLGCDQPFSWSHAVETHKVTVSDIPKPLGGPTVEVRAKQRFMCNMEPKDGLMELILALAEDVLGI